MTSEKLYNHLFVQNDYMHYMTKIITNANILLKRGMFFVEFSLYMAKIKLIRKRKYMAKTKHINKQNENYIYL